MAYTLLRQGLAKASAPGAAIIQFFGGIHEVYFPYVLMKPKLILAMIAGGMTGSPDQRHLRLGPARARRARLDLRGLLRRRRAATSSGVTLACSARAAVSLPGRGVPAQDGQDRRRGRPRRRHRADGGHEGQEVGRLGRVLGRGADRADPLDRVRLRRRHGLLGDGRLGAAQEDPGRRAPRGHGRQQGDRQPERRLRHRGHPPGPHRRGPRRGPRRRSTSRWTTSWAARGTTRSSS